MSPKSASVAASSVIHGGFSPWRSASRSPSRGGAANEVTANKDRPAPEVQAAEPPVVDLGDVAEVDVPPVEEVNPPDRIWRLRLGQCLVSHAALTR